MAFSTTSKTFLSQSTAAYDKFEKHQIPFTAAKIYISGSKNAGNKFDDVVGKKLQE